MLFLYKRPVSLSSGTRPLGRRRAAIIRQRSLAWYSGRVAYDSGYNPEYNPEFWWNAGRSMASLRVPTKVPHASGSVEEPKNLRPLPAPVVAQLWMDPCRQPGDWRLPGGLLVWVELCVGPLQCSQDVHTSRWTETRVLRPKNETWTAQWRRSESGVSLRTDEQLGLLYRHLRCCGFSGRCWRGRGLAIWVCVAGEKVFLASYMWVVFTAGDPVQVAVLSRFLPQSGGM